MEHWFAKICGLKGVFPLCLQIDNGRYVVVELLLGVLVDVEGFIIPQYKRFKQLSLRYVVPASAIAVAIKCFEIDHEAGMAVSRRLSVLLALMHPANFGALMTYILSSWIEFEILIWRVSS